MDDRYLTPASLLERLAHPDNGTDWERFVDLYLPLLFYWSRKLGLQEHDAADLVQDILTTLVQKMPHFQYDQTQSFRAWLRTLLMNRFRDRQRRAQPTQVLNVDPPGEDAALLLEESEYDQLLVQHAMKYLKREFREKTWKAFWEHGAMGRSAEEVAKELQVTPGAVYAAKFRVLAKLRAELKGLLDEEG